jgi:menaquinone-9 beta-reductase
MPQKEAFDVVIAGAGPSGCTTALFLAKSGLNIAVLDRSEIPARKVCGDALSGTVMSLLKSIDDECFSDFMKQEAILPSWGIRFFSPDREFLDIPFTADRNGNTPVPGVTIKRYDFEKFLISRLEKFQNITFLPKHNVREITFSPDEERFRLSGDHFMISARFVVGADGANSIVGRSLAGNNLNRSKLCLGVRGYFRGVKNLHPDNFVELHFLKELLPGYLWIFPMKNGIVNAGIGIMNGKMKDDKMSHPEFLLSIINSYPDIKKRFSESKLQDKIETHFLPFGPDKKQICGERFLLTGDAASLVDPFTGEGIGNSMMSGKIASGYILKAFEKNDFSEKIFRGYQGEIEQKITRDLRTSWHISRVASNEWLFNYVIRKANSGRKLKEAFTSMYTDPKARKRLTNPWFYLRMVTDP